MRSPALLADSSRNSRTPTFGVYGVGELALMPASVAHLQSTEADDGGTIDRSPDVPVLPASIPSSDRLADEALGVLDRARPPGLIPTSDLGGCPLVDYDPVLGLDGTGRSVIYCTTTFNGLAVARRVGLDWVSQADRSPGIPRSAEWQPGRTAQAHHSATRPASCAPP
jgi:hypothetical protein